MKKKKRKTKVCGHHPKVSPAEKERIFGICYDIILQGIEKEENKKHEKEK